MDPLQINNDESMKVLNFSHSSYSFDAPKSSSCNSSRSLVGSFTLKEEGSFRNGRSQKKRGGLVEDLSSTGELIWLSSVSNNSKLDEKIYLKTTVEIEKLTKRTIEENCCGKWRCSACRKIENSFYFLQLHKSTNCETGLSFICEICCKEIINYPDFAIHYIEHEADKKKKCPICLCPNGNDIKEHVIMENHLSEDITGFKFTDNEFQRINEKAKPEVFFNSTINGYCQDFKDRDLLSTEDHLGHELRKLILEHGPHSSITDRKPSFKIELNVPVQQPEASFEQPIIYDTKADLLPFVKTQNIEVFSASADVDAAKMSPVSNEFVLDNEEQADQGKPALRRRKNNAVYNEFRDFDINDIIDEDTKADILPFVKTQNIEVFSVSADVDAAKMSPVSNEFVLDNQEQADQGKLALRRRKNNAVCNEFYDFHINDIIDKEIEGTQFSKKVDRPDRHGTMNLGMAYSGEDSANLAISGKFLSKFGFQCFVCEKTFSRREHLKRHSRQFHPVPYFDENSALKKHICDICDCQVRDVWVLKIHKKSHYTPSTSKLKQSWQCELCGVYVSKNVDVTVHMSKHKTDISRYDSRLNRADKSINSSSASDAIYSGSPTGASANPQRSQEVPEKKVKIALQRVSNITIQETLTAQWRCDACGKIERSLYLLQLHKFTRCETGSSFKCGKCPLKTEKYTDFVVHCVEHDAGEERRCPICLWIDVYNMEEHFVVKGHVPREFFGMEYPGNLLLVGMDKRQMYSTDDAITDDRVQEPDEYSGEACEIISCETFYTEALPRKEPSKGETCPGSKKNYSTDQGLIFQKWEFTDNSKVESSAKNTAFEKIPTMQSPRNTYVCRICNESFSLRLLLLNHVKAHDRIEIQQCEFYCSQLKNKCHLDRRCDTQDGTIDSLECDICKKSYPHRRSFLRHKRRHAKAKQYFCYICGVSLCSPKSLKLHMQRHAGEKSLLCDICGMQFRLRESLNHHVKIHHGKENGQTPEKLFECEICNRTLETRRGYRSHVKRHTQPKTHGCTFCQRKFYTRFMLKEHMRTHTGEKPLECQTCGYTCAHYASLYSHMKCHSIERPHRCELCSKTFKNRKTRDDHLNTHTGARPYKCKQCGKGFGSGNGLRTHKKIHKGKRFREKKYSCNICSEVFAVSAYRDLHVALHTNPNPFNCEFCCKSFNFKKNMVAHMQRVHPDRNPFKCKLCCKTYDSLKKIRVHITSSACEKKEKSPEKMKNQSKPIEVDGKMNIGKMANLFVCNICEEEFMSTEDILSHFNSLHKHSK